MGDLAHYAVGVVNEFSRLADFYREGHLGDGRLPPLVADSEVDRSGNTRREGHGDRLAALGDHRHRAVPTLEVEVIDVNTDGFGHA